MNLIIDSLLDGAQKAEGTAIIIDVFRAFTTAAIAFSKGAKSIVLVDTPSKAIKLREQGVGDLCMGEVHGAKPDGFDFGNSPYELSLAEIRGQTLIHSTMAGTVGVTAAKNAEHIYLGSLVLAKATANRILTDDPDVVTIVAMGGGGRFRTDEDEQCALYIRNLLEGRQPDTSAVRSLVLSGSESLKFSDSNQPQFHRKDIDMALEIDSCPFAIKVNRIDGLLIATPDQVL
ncbi:MAG: 2-phosphosulfolactate phosphatase [Chloroflexota bacterium]|nr:2-phosphosulfolactate phosphatase [Chloroflexota bacterium]